MPKTLRPPPIDPPSETNITAGESSPTIEMEVAQPTRLRGLGWKPDQPDARDRPAHARLGAPRNLPTECLKLLDHLRGVEDQGDAEGCVAFARGSADDLRLRRLGLNPPNNSRLALWAAIRARELTKPTDSLMNVGCYPRDAIVVAREYGFTAEQDWPFVEANFNVRPPWDVAQKSSAFRVTDYHRILSTGAGLDDDMANAIHQDFPITFGAPVSRAFMDWTGSKASKAAVSMVDPKGGGHAMCILGYTTVNGERWYLVLNSWSELWGDHGLAWVRASEFRKPGVGDFWIAEVAMSEEPKGSEEVAT